MTDCSLPDAVGRALSPAARQRILTSLRWVMTCSSHPASAGITGLEESGTVGGNLDHARTLRYPAVADVTLTLLAVAYPAFRFARITDEMRTPRWVAVRKNSTEPGVHTVVTDDLDELQAALGPAALRSGSDLDRQPGDFRS